MRPIKVQYKTLIQQRRLGDKLYVMEAIRSLDEAIDVICEVLTEEEQKDPFAEDLCPYFGILWPAAEGLSQYLAQNPKLVKNKIIDYTIVDTWASNSNKFFSYNEFMEIIKFFRSYTSNHIEIFKILYHLNSDLLSFIITFAGNSYLHFFSECFAQNSLT